MLLRPAHSTPRCAEQSTASGRRDSQEAAAQHDDSAAWPAHLAQVRVRRGVASAVAPDAAGQAGEALKARLDARIVGRALHTSSSKGCTVSAMSELSRRGGRGRGASMRRREGIGAALAQPHQAVDREEAGDALGAEGEVCRLALPLQARGVKRAAVIGIHTLGRRGGGAGAA